MAWGTPTSLAASVGTGSAAHSLASNTLSASAGTLVVVTGGIRANASGDAIVVTDSAGNTWTVFSHYRTTTGMGAFIAYSILANTITNGAITVSDTSNGATNFAACAFQAFSVTGGASSSVEDTAAEGSHDGTSTTTPTVTSGTPSVAGDLFFATYVSGGANTGAYTEDATNGWTNAMLKAGAATGTTITTSSGYQINAGTGTLTHTPTTSSFVYSQVVVAFKVAGGTVNNQTVSVNTTPNPAIVRQTGKVNNTNSTPNPAIVRLTGKIVSGNSTPNGSIVRSTSKIVKTNTTPDPSIVRTMGKIASVDTTPNPSISRSTGKIVSIDTTPDPSMTEVPAHQFAQTISVDTTPVPSIATVFTPFTPTADLHVIRIASPPKLKVDRTGS